MLVSVTTGNIVTRVPHQEEYTVWKRRLTEEQLHVIKAELNRRIDGGDVHTAGWIPGSQWAGTPYEPIYSVACKMDEVASGKCFGLIFWDVMMERVNERWGFGRYEKDGTPIHSLTYFRLR